MAGTSAAVDYSTVLGLKENCCCFVERQKMGYNPSRGAIGWYKK